MYIVDNLNLFANACFWPLLIWGAVGGICFKTTPALRQNRSLKIIGVMICIMLGWRLLIPLASKRYMMPLILPISVFALAGLYAGWEFAQRKKIAKICFLLLVSVSVIFSAGKFFRGAQKAKLNGLLQQAETLQRDFRTNGYHKAALISNSRDVGLVFLQAGLPGQHYCAQQNEQLPSVTQQKLSQYDVCYLSIAEKDGEAQSLSDIATCSIHNYRLMPISSGTEIRYAGKTYRLFKIVSNSEPITVQAAGMLRNGDFRVPDRQTIDRKLAQNIPFLAEREEIGIPEDWVLTLTNKRGKRFNDWSMSYETAQDAPPSLVFHAAGCGIAMRSKTKFKPGDYAIVCRASGSPDASLYFFLYSYDPQGDLTAQDIGYLTPQDDGKIERQLMIRASDLPPATKFFHIGFIASGKAVCPKQIDLVQTNNPPSEK